MSLSIALSCCTCVGFFMREMDTAILQSIRNRVINNTGTAAMGSYSQKNDKIICCISPQHPHTARVYNVAFCLSWHVVLIKEGYRGASPLVQGINRRKEKVSLNFGFISGVCITLGNRYPHPDQIWLSPIPRSSRDCNLINLEMIPTQFPGENYAFLKALDVFRMNQALISFTNKAPQ